MSPVGENPKSHESAGGSAATLCDVAALRAYACPRCGSEEWGAITYSGCSECAPDSVFARWHGGIARVEVCHEPEGRKRVYLRLTLAEALKLRDDLDDVIEERKGDDDDE